MPSLYDYRLFISHAWKYGDDYDRLVRFLDNANYFSYRNYSAPRENHFSQLVHLLLTMTSGD